VNASPLILLAKTNYLRLLTDMADEVVVPAGVAAEVLRADSSDLARKALEAGFGARYDECGVPQSVLDWRLGSGESAVLAVALSRTDCKAVLDDALARRCAKALGVRCIGTLGLSDGARNSKYQNA
jgi:predicted nucleic acid-binding protein